MSSRITQAVIPVAGLGTRMLPATKSQPKEMLPIGTKPVVQYVVEELESCGVTRVLFVTGKTKSSIENHFDADIELRRALEISGKQDLLDALKFESIGASFYYIRQRAQRGLGDAVSYAEDFTRNEPFIVGLGDSIMIKENGGPGIVQRLCETFETRDAAAAIAFQEVPRENVSKYGIAMPAQEGDVFRLEDIVEKPSVADAPSNLAVTARYVFGPEIFQALREIPPGKGGEIQLTDAVRLLIRKGRPVYGVKLSPGERRLDIGNFTSYFKGFIEVVLKDPVYGAEMRRYAAGLLKQLEG
ncbi:MAG TPA: UTP--glucose-1-phosphate uridylyltransferase [Candidatus Brocadiia bacterium]|nr:UTP--glucose-1-phosphate uridylyltransferase [Candidatus Brocadiia bacterium]